MGIDSRWSWGGQDELNSELNDVGVEEKDVWE
jgi:hypothetical protein